MTNQILKKATGQHFNLPGHSLLDMEVTIVEKVFNKDGQYRRARENNYIQDFNTKYEGMNRNS